MSPSEPLVRPLVLEALVEAVHLPAMPHAALEVLRIANDESAGSQELAASVSLDPALAAQILRVANSGLFGRRSEISTLQTACAHLGFTEVKLLTLSFALNSAILRAPHSSFDYDMYASRSLVRAVSAKLLAEMVAPDLKDKAFVTGLLSRIGQLLLASCLTKDYEGVLADCEEDWPTTEQEERLLGFSGRELGAVLLRTWNLPAAIYGGVLFAEQPDTVSADFPPETRALAGFSAAAALFEEGLCGRDRSLLLPRLRVSAGAVFGLTAAAVDEVLSKVSRQTAEAADGLQIRLADGLDVEEVLREAQYEAFQETVDALHETVHSGHRVGEALLDRARTCAILRHALFADESTGS